MRAKKRFLTQSAKIAKAPKITIAFAYLCVFAPLRETFFHRMRFDCLRPATATIQARTNSSNHESTNRDHLPDAADACSVSSKHGLGTL